MGKFLFLSVASVHCVAFDSSPANFADVICGLQNFLRDLLREAKKINDVSEDKLIEYTDTMVSASLLIGTTLY